MEIEILQKLSEQDFEFKIHYTVNEYTTNCLNFYLETPDDNDWDECCVHSFFKIYEAESFKDGVEWLATKACEFYPESEFAKWWKEQQEKNNVGN